MSDDSADRKTVERGAVRGMQAVLVVLFAYTLVSVSLGLAVGVGVSLVVTMLPALLRRESGYSMDPRLVLWITLSVFVHTLGSLGPYEWFGWYDSVAHTVSAVVIAGIGYVTLRAFELHSEEIDIPSEFRAVFILVFVLAMGVLWELLEFGAGGLARALGADAPLAVRGVGDIVNDLVFNTVGAVIVAVVGTNYLRGLVSFLRLRVP